MSILVDLRRAMIVFVDTNGFIGLGLWLEGYNVITHYKMVLQLNIKT